MVVLVLLALVGWQMFLVSCLLFACFLQTFLLSVAVLAMFPLLLVLLMPWMEG